MIWSDFPRRTDKVALVGFSETSRELAPYDDPSFEIWALNEEYNYPWLKRFDRWFQLHPQWDFTRTNNLNDPNHYSWLRNETGPCLFCKGSGLDPKGETCKYCNHGTYFPARRDNVPVYMQQAWDDIPLSVTYPLDAITQRFLSHLNYPYFTSSPAYMIALAMMYDFKEIHLFGFEMGSDTEYHYQRACMEYWMGLADGLGYKIILPDVCQIRHGKLYGYENMQTGYRQQLEMRKAFLQNQLNQETQKRFNQEGRLAALKEIGAPMEKMMDETKKYTNLLALINNISGAMTETSNLTKLYDSYFRGNDEQKASQEHTTAAYKNPEAPKR